MKIEEKASISIMKIICVSIILILISGIAVIAVNTGLNDVTITLQNGYEMKVITSKTKVLDILEENNIIVEENQKTIPGIEEEVTSGQNIKITDKSYTEVKIAEISKEGVETSLEQLLQNYTPITEKIVKQRVAIPYETITKNAVQVSEDTTNKVLQQGKNGVKEITYKIKYQNDVEIEKIVISEKVVQEPVNKIVQVQKVQTTRAAEPRTTTTSSTKKTTTTTINGETYKITAYCSCNKCCGSSTGKTASGTKATPGKTVATSSKFAFGTKLNIGGHIYTVEDRGGAISGNRIDVYVSSHAQALQWGVKYLPVSIVK